MMGVYGNFRGEFPFFFAKEKYMEIIRDIAGPTNVPEPNVVEAATDTPSPEECAAQIFVSTGQKFEPETAAMLWSKIVQHKWMLSEKLGRDVGVKVACIDFVENVDPMTNDLEEAEQIQRLRELGAQVVDRSVWETISESQPPKQIVNNRIIRLVQRSDLARKHGVVPPRAIIFFGPPGTGKTHFVRAIAGVLQWWYIEISPSTLMADGQDRLGANLKKLMEKVHNLDEAVIFIDEFEEIAGSRDQASRIDKSITNEFLKQVPLFKAQERKNLLVCATNYIRQLDAALLRPGRFDCIIPVGGLDNQGHRTIFEHYLASTNLGEVDLDRVVAMTPLFTPADIEYLFQKVRQHAFEQEYVRQQEYLVTTETFLEIIPQVRPSLTDEIIKEFEEDCERYTRH
jgi:transitional endoplasmic reticulum ATPase